MRAALAAVAIGVHGLTAHAADIETLDVDHAQNRYRMHLVARLDAPLQASYAVFSDFDNLPLINDAIERIQRVSGAPEDVQRLYTRVRVCVWFYCTHLDQVQDIRAVNEGGALGLDAIVLPEQSNLRYGHARWRMRDCGGDTCLAFDAELEPDFWVPPIIGPWAIERVMRSEALQTSHGIERLAGAERRR